jgi:hypothetical protein
MQGYEKERSESSDNQSGRVPAGALLDSYGHKSGESGKQADSGYLADHSQKVTARFTPMKRRARAMARFVADRIGTLPHGSIEREKLETVEKELRLCRNHLLFRNHFTEQRVTLSKMKSCKRTRLCPLCAVARANGHVVSYHKKTEQLVREASAQESELRAYFVTLTKKHGVSLEETYTDFARSVTRLVNRRRDAMKAREGSVKHAYALQSVMASVSAGVFSFEVKRGSGSGLWNVHTHGLLLSTEAIDGARLSAEWHKLTGDSYIVDVQEIGTDNVKALCEVLKYSVKFSEMTLEDNFEAAMTLQNKRLIRSFGDYYGLKPDDSADIDDATVLDSPYIEQLYSYTRGSYVVVPGDGAVIVPMNTRGKAKPIVQKRQSKLK